MKDRRASRLVLVAVAALALAASAQAALTASPKDDTTTVATTPAPPAKPDSGSGPPPKPTPVPPRAAATDEKPASGAEAQSVQGIVQALTGSRVVVRQLDGNAVRVPYDKKTQILVAGKPATITDVKAGFVLIANWTAGKPATVLHFVRPG